MKTKELVIQINSAEAVLEKFGETLHALGRGKHVEPCKPRLLILSTQKPLCAFLQPNDWPC